MSLWVVLIKLVRVKAVILITLMIIAVKPRVLPLLAAKKASTPEKPEMKGLRMGIIRPKIENMRAARLKVIMSLSLLFSMLVAIFI